MQISKAYKVELKPNNKQKAMLNKAIGTARFSYNWGLNYCKELHEKGEKFPGDIGLHKALCSIKKSEYPWMYEVSKCAPQSALIDLDLAFKKFFKKGASFPRFKSKKNPKSSFRLDNINFKVQSHCIKLPNMTAVRLKEHGYIPTENVKYMNCTVSKEVDRYFASVSVIEEVPDLTLDIEDVIGVDVGIKTLAVCSNGDIYANPKNAKKNKKKLSRAQRSLSRKKKGSSNRKKQILKVAKIHRKVKNSRLDSIHKMTTEITRTKCRVVVLEDLNVSGMLKNHKLAGAVADASFGEISRQLDYKTKFYGGATFYIDRWFPSSKMCSDCGSIKEDLKLSDRMYKCTCGLSIDRDLNASINIRNYFLSTVSSTGS
jgi:putative transposase